MIDKLSKVENSSVHDLQEISSEMHQYINRESEAALQMAAEAQSLPSGILARFFPNAFQREQSRLALERIRDTYNARGDLFKLYTAVHLEIAKKQGDTLIASVGVDLQTRLSVFAAARLDDITQTMDQSRNRFLTRMKPLLDDLQKYKDTPELYQPARESMVHEIKIYFESIRELLSGFAEALKSRVASSR